MFNLKKLKLSKRARILYIDTNIRDHYFISEMLDNKFEILFANSEKTAIEAYNNTSDSIDLILLAIDQINHHHLLNKLYAYKDIRFPRIVLLTQDIDSANMYRLMGNYGAIDYIVKPFSKQVLTQIVSFAVDYNSPYSQRLYNDLSQFNQFLDQLYDEKIINSPMDQFGFDTLQNQVKQLNTVSDILMKNKGIEELNKSKRPNILFIDDEKSIIDIYRQFISNKPFNAFFSYDLAESRKYLSKEKIDIIILDLGLPDGHGVNLLDELYKSDVTNPEKPDVIVVSSYFEKDTVVNVIRSGARVYINKPMSYQYLISVIYEIIFLRYCRVNFNIEKIIKKELKEVDG